MKGKRGQFLPLLVLAVGFAAGILLGQALAGRVPAETGGELRRYLDGYLRLDGGRDLSAGTVLRTGALYLRYPLAAFLLGFASIGAALLPLTAVCFGFFLSFSVCCFTAAFGGGGVLLALAAFGLRCAVTLPVFLLVGVRAWASSLDLVRRSAPRGRRALIPWLSVLTAGIWADLMLTPWLLARAAETILT